MLRSLAFSVLSWLALPGPALAKVPTRMPDDERRGRDLYQDLCWQCHGAAGQGDGPLAAQLSPAPPSLRGRPEATWPALVTVVQEGRGDMPAFLDSLGRFDTRRIFVWLASLDQADTELRPTRVPGGDEAQDDQDEGGDPPAE